MPWQQIVKNKMFVQKRLFSDWVILSLCRDSDEKCAVIVSIGGVSRSRQDSGPLQVELFVSTNGGTAILSQAALSVAVEVSLMILTNQTINPTIKRVPNILPHHI